jgi:nucleotide-binding universal stress UspA family protein
MRLDPTAPTLESPTIGGGTMNRILVATDGSPSALEASRFGIELAREHDAELVFAHVVPEFDLVPATVFQIGGVFPHEPGPHDAALLWDAAALAAEQGVLATTALLRGETVDALVEYANSHDVDLIVVGSRGHGAITGTLLGSVSLGLLRAASRPVAVVRAATVATEAAR